jgi:hypothetical protein
MPDSKFREESNGAAALLTTIFAPGGVCTVDKLVCFKHMVRFPPFSGRSGVLKFYVICQ